MDWAYWTKSALLGLGALAIIYLVAKLVGKALMEGFIEEARKHNKEAKENGEKEKDK